jgi:hypothetical protein
MTYRIELHDVQAGEGRHIADSYAYWHKPEFMAAIADLHHVKGLQLQVYKGEELFALLPLFERSKMGIKAIVAPVGAYYQGISFAFEANVSAPRKLLDTTAVCGEIAGYLAARYRRVHFRLNPENTDVRGFSWNGFKASPLYTFRSSAAAELPSLPDERKKLRTAQNLGMSLEERFDSEVFIRLQKDLDQRKSHKLGISYSGLQSFVEKLFSAGLLKQFNVLWDGKPVSSNILLHDGGDVAYTLFQATAEDAMRKGAATFHSLSLLQHLPAGTRIFDYCGANVQEVARFKAALGLELVNFYQIRL